MNNSLKSRLRNSWLRVFGFFLVDTINNLKVKVLKRDLVLIYQMGKVASSSIYNSLKDKKNVTYQIHRFDEDYIKEVNDFNKNKSGFSESKIVDERSVRIKKLFLKKPSKPIFLISLVRDPIERNVSAFFQNKNHLAKNYSYANTQDLIELFYNLYAHETPLIWFDKEFKKTTGVDVYDFPFNKKQKHTIFNANNFNVLLLRVDLEDSEKSKIIQQFLSEDVVEIKNKNIGALKGYNSEYKEFMKNLDINEAYLDKMLNSKFIKHFYTEEEVQAMYNKWHS
jgi:hypothetical protein